MILIISCIRGVCILMSTSWAILPRMGRIAFCLPSEADSVHFSYSYFPVPANSRISARRNLGALMQTILTLTVFPPPSLLKQQKPRRRQRHAQYNQKKLTRQAHEDDQYPGNDQEDTRDPPSPAATPAHAHPLLLYPYARESFSCHPISAG